MVRRAAGAGLKRAQALREAIEDVGLLFDPLRLHHVRIGVKKLRYVLELADESRTVPAAKMLTRLKDAQSRLGRLHDLQVLLVFARGTQLEVTRRSRALRGALRDAIERECHKEHARYLRRRDRLIAVCDAVSEWQSAGGPAGAHVARSR